MQTSLRKTMKWGFEHVLPGFVHRPLDFRLKDQITRLEGDKTDFNLLELRGSNAIRQTAWLGLGSIGYEIVKQFKPRVAVELGSHTGYSTFAMALALRDLGEGGKLYAVDTWMGDPHAGVYGEDVYDEFLDDRRKLNLQDTVIPLRMTFEEASRHIETGIDLLHIDGWHTFTAVRTDFRQFRPLLNPKAIVLFHDVRTHFKGMRWFWTLMRMQYESFRIPYMHGLGIIRMP